MSEEQKAPPKYPTHHPASKNGKWTTKELDAITEEWIGHYIGDGEGLSGRVRQSKSGNMSVQFRYVFRLPQGGVVKDKTAFFQCGEYPANTMLVIRNNRDEAKLLVKKGIDPRDQKIATKIKEQEAVVKVIQDKEKADDENKSIRDLYTDWITEGVRRGDGNANLKLTFEKHFLPILGSIKVRDLTKKHLTDLYKKIILDEGTIRTGVELNSSVKQMFKWAEQHQPWRKLLSEGNPSSTIDVSTYVPDDYSPARKRIVSVFEINKLWNIFKKADEEYDPANKYLKPLPIKKESQYAVWLCFSTLCRVGEMRMTEWSHIDLEAREWVIPGKNIKGKKGITTIPPDHEIFISDFTFEMLTELKKLTGHTQWLFPSDKNNNHITDKVITRSIRDKQMKFSKLSKKPSHRTVNNSLVLGDEKWTPHDLRRTGATMMQQLDIDRETINLCQNHAVGSKVDKHYLLSAQRKRKMLAWITLSNHIYSIFNAKNDQELSKFKELKFLDYLEMEENS